MFPDTRWSRKKRNVIRTVITGVVALSTPASALDTYVSARANKYAGMTFTKSANTKEAPHNFADPERGIRRMPLQASRAPAPRSVLTAATPKGVSDVSARLMNRNDNPQTMPSAINPGNHDDVRGDVEVTGVTS